MARPKSRPPVPKAEPKSTTGSVKSGQGKSGKLWPILLGLAILGLLGWGLLSKIAQGPKTPLPREAFGIKLGSSSKDAQQAIPKLVLRPYNNDPDFKIVSMKASEGIPTGLTSLDLIYYKDQLFFISQQWDGKSTGVNLDAMAHDFRRWSRKGAGNPQSLGEGASLREWYFSDGGAEMILRELKYNDQVQTWQDLRDASNPDAVAAFAKYRIDG